MINRVARPKHSTLTRDGVVGAAIAMIGSDGLESFSMPRLAKSVGVSPPSLYHHFEGKEDLLAAIARFIATPESPSVLPPEADWTDYLVSSAVALRRRVVSYPHCASLLVRYMPKDNMFDEYEQMCQFLETAGVPARLHVRIVDGLTALTLGAAMLNENAAHYTSSGPGPTANPATHPAVCAALESVGDATPDEQFESYVRTYLASVVADIADARGART